MTSIPFWQQPWFRPVMLAILGTLATAAPIVAVAWPAAGPAINVVAPGLDAARRAVEQLPETRQPAPPEIHCTQADLGRCRVATWLEPMLLQRCDGATWGAAGVYDGGTSGCVLSGP